VRHCFVPAVLAVLVVVVLVDDVLSARCGHGVSPRRG
jgi:hypothetical protein